MALACWIPPGQPVTVAGHRITAGLVYYGRHLRTAAGAVEPAQIDPDLPADDAAGDPGTGEPGGGAVPAYHALAPAARAGYLRWLAGDRRDTGAPAWHVLLFLSGIERRVLVDAARDPGARRDLAAIAAELRRLRTGYADARPGVGGIHGGGAGSGGAAAGGAAAGGVAAGAPAVAARVERLLAVVELLAAPRPRRGGAVAFGAPPAAGGPRTPVPVQLRTGLARAAATGTPVPADWALSWAWHHPDLPQPAPQRRCPEEYRRLFTLRYAQRYGAGFVPPPSGPPVRIGYQPASPGLAATVVERPDLPDVLAGAAGTAALGSLLDEVAEALTPYSRWLARHPESRGSLAATALLPPELVDPSTGPLSHLVAWATAHLDGGPSGVVDAAEFAAFWSTSTPERMSRAEVEGLAAVLASVGLGVEPDARFAGPCLRPGPAVLFRLAPDAPGPPASHQAPVADAPGPAYPAAAWAVDLAAGLVGARQRDGLGDGRLDAMIDGVVAQLGSVTAASGGPGADAVLTGAERVRLAARLRWRLLGDRPAAASPARPASDRSAPDRSAPGGTGASLATAGQVAADQVAAERAAAERAAAGRLLVTVAVHTTGVTPAVVAALVERYRLIGLDPALVHSRLIWSADDVRSGRAVDQEPVVVRPAGDDDPEYALPWAAGRDSPGSPLPDTLRPRANRPAAARPDKTLHDTAHHDTAHHDTAHHDTAHHDTAHHDAVRLDEDVLARLRSETTDVSDLLAGIFTATDEPSPPARALRPPMPPPVPPPPAPDRGVVPVAGLDLAHSAVLLELAARSSWTREAFAALAGRHGLLPDGAIDVLNEAAMAATGEPLLDEEDDLSVDPRTVQELLG